MYKNSIVFRFPWRYLFKLLLTMKLVTLLLTVTFLQAGAMGYAQKVTIHVKKASIANVLERIQQQTGYDFLYNSAHLEGTSAVNLSFQDAPLNEVLEACFSGQPLTYQIENTTVLVRRLPKALRPVIEEIPQREVSGRVTDSEGRPLEGVTVTVIGMSIVTTTTAAGQFSLLLPPGATRSEEHTSEL